MAPWLMRLGTFRDSHVAILIGIIFAFLISKYVYSVIFINVTFANFRIFIFSFF